MLDAFQYIQYFDFTLILACVLLSIIFADCSRESDSCVDKLLSQKLKYTGYGNRQWKLIIYNMFI